MPVSRLLSLMVASVFLLALSHAVRAAEDDSTVQDVITALQNESDVYERYELATDLYFRACGDVEGPFFAPDLEQIDQIGGILASTGDGAVRMYLADVLGCVGSRAESTIPQLYKALLAFIEDERLSTVDPVQLVVRGRHEGDAICTAFMTIGSNPAPEMCSSEGRFRMPRDGN
jgi:hypothetical protein